MWCSVLQFREQTGQNKSYIKIKYATSITHRSVEPTCTYSHTVSKLLFSFIKLQELHFPVRVYLGSEEKKSLHFIAQHLEECWSRITHLTFQKCDSYKHSDLDIFCLEPRSLQTSCISHHIDAHSSNKNKEIRS